MEGTMLSTRARWGLGGLGALVAALLVGVLLLRPGVEQLAPGTPEGTVQGYLQAVLDGDHRAALGYLTPELAEACRRDAGWAPESVRISLADAYVDGDRAEVDVVVTELFAPGPFESGSHSYDVTLYLERAGDGWAISTAPWPLWTCEEMP